MRRATRELPRHALGSASHASIVDGAGAADQGARQAKAIASGVYGRARLAGHDGGVAGAVRAITLSRRRCGSSPHQPTHSCTVRYRSLTWLTRTRRGRRNATRCGGCRPPSRALRRRSRAQYKQARAPIHEKVPRSSSSPTDDTLGEMAGKPPAGAVWGHEHHAVRAACSGLCVALQADTAHRAALPRRRWFH